MGVFSGLAASLSVHRSIWHSREALSARMALATRAYMPDSLEDTPAGQIHMMEAGMEEHMVVKGSVAERMARIAATEWNRAILKMHKSTKEAIRGVSSGAGLW